MIPPYLAVSRAPAIGFGMGGARDRRARGAVSGARGCGVASPGCLGLRGSGRAPRGQQEPGRTHHRDASPLAGRAGLAAAGARRTRRKGKAGPSGSLSWDTSCSTLGPRRSRRLSGSLPAPRPPHSILPLGRGVHRGDIRHPQPGPRAAPPLSSRARALAPAGTWAPLPGWASPRPRVAAGRWPRTQSAGRRAGREGA